MKRILFNILFSFILLFILSLNVNAECSYNERTQLLNEAKEVEVFFEVAEKEVDEWYSGPNGGDDILVKKNISYLKMNFINISDNLYIRVKNEITGESFRVEKEDLVSGIYSIDIENIEDIIPYSISYKSKLKNCKGYEVYTKKVNKPKFNIIYTYNACSNDLVKDSKYCKEYIDTEFSMKTSEIQAYLDKLIKENEEASIIEEEKSFIDLIKLYWYIPASIILLIIIVVVIFLINKKRGELV